LQKIVFCAKFAQKGGSDIKNKELWHFFESVLFFIYKDAQNRQPVPPVCGFFADFSGGQRIYTDCFNPDFPSKSVQKNKILIV